MVRRLGAGPRPRSVVEEAVVERVADEFGAGGAAELLLDVGAVGLDGAGGEEQLAGDLGVGGAEGDQAQDFELAVAEVVGRAGGGGGGGGRGGVVGVVARRAPSRGLR